ncbi:hypothetical protein, partial [Candidatus Allofournierella excrementavium]|uniref:hypothetical protein n=1 Tax=Candidatus Allofournierella excrementavium TaxID=2838591 RepID=UPI003AB762A4
SSIMIDLPPLWAIKAPFSTGLNGASSKLLFCVYFCLTSAGLQRPGGFCFHKLHRLPRPPPLRTLPSVWYHEKKLE